MLFNSVIFLFAFLPVAYVVFWSLKTSERRYRRLTITGYVFYGFWDYRFCALMAFSTVVSYLAGLGMLKWDRVPSRRRLCLVIPVVDRSRSPDLLQVHGPLAGHGTTRWRSTVRPAAEHTRVPRHPADRYLVLHVPHHLATSSTLTGDVITPTRNFFEFSCYVSLFSQLVAGPIVRFRQIEGDLEESAPSIERRIGIADGPSSPSA